MLTAPLTINFEYTVFGDVFPTGTPAERVDPEQRAAVEHAIGDLPYFHSLHDRASEPRYGSATFEPSDHPAADHWTESILQNMVNIDGITNVHIDDAGGA